MESVRIKIEYVKGVLWFRAANTVEIKENEDPQVMIKGYVQKLTEKNSNNTWLEVYIDNNIGVPEECMNPERAKLSNQISEFVKGSYESLVMHFEDTGIDSVTLIITVLNKKIGKI